MSAHDRVGARRPRTVGLGIAAACVVLASLAGLARFAPRDREHRPHGRPGEAAPLADAGDALTSPDFRITGVHFWQGNWNYNFWGNLKAARAARELHRIRDLGFNTIVLTIPWGEFQPDAAPVRYRNERYTQLNALLDAAEEARLYVVLRVGTIEHVPSGIDGGSNYAAPYLFFDDAQLAAYADLGRETAARTAGHRNLLFLFWTWEDLMGFMNAAHQPEAARLAYAARAPAFREHLRSRPIAEWNRAWGTDYRDWDDVPFPAYRTPAFADLWRFADERLIDAVLPTLAAAAHAGNPQVRLSYEVRIDVEPIDGGANVDHERTWRLPAGYDLATAYFNPYWGAPNVGDVIAPEAALRNFRSFLDRFEARTDRERLFFDQFNFVDSTPAFRHNSRLGDERAIFDFLSAAIPEMYRRSVGYALWSLDRYEANLLYNSSFESGGEAWEVRSGAVPSTCATIRDDTERRERYLMLAPGCGIRQTVTAPWNPGAAAPEEPYHARVSLRGRPGTSAVVAYETSNGETWRTAVERTVALGTTWTTVDLELPFDWAFRFDVTAPAGASVDVDDVAVFNHVQDAALFDTRGEPLGRRPEAVGAQAARWRARHPSTR